MKILMSMRNRILIKITLWCLDNIELGSMGLIVYKHLVLRNIEKMKEAL